MKLRIDQDTTVLVDFLDIDPHELDELEVGDVLMEQAEVELDEMLRAVRRIAEHAGSSFRRTGADGPDEVAMRFSVGVNDAAAVVVRSPGELGFEVEMKWSRRG